jgi:hypothetical protein
MTNNAINIGSIATNAEAVAGTDDRKPVSPESAFAAIAAASLYPVSKNLSISAAGGVVTIASRDGTALSASNKGLIYLHSTTTLGAQKLIEITANQTLSVTTMTNNLLGTSAGSAWSEFFFPLYIYAVADVTETNVIFMACRLNHLRYSPVSTKIGTPSSADANTQGSMFAFSNITVADYAETPCVCIGSVMSTKDASEAYTVQSPLQLATGAGVFPFEKQIAISRLPRGMYDAIAARHFRPNGGTAPNYGTSIVQYALRNEGVVWVSYNFNSQSGGAGAVPRQGILPFVPDYEGLTNQNGQFVAIAYQKIYANYAEYYNANTGFHHQNVTTLANMPSTFIIMRVSEE